MTERREENEFDLGLGGGLDEDSYESPFDPHDRRTGHHHTSSHSDNHGEHQCLEWCPICRGADILRQAVPPELHDQMQAVQRDALLLARSLIEAHLSRLQEEQMRKAEHRNPEDIPLD